MSTETPFWSSSKRADPCRGSIPLTFSITQGLLWGFISHVVLYVLVGRARQITPMLWLIAAISVLLVVLGQRTP